MMQNKKAKQPSFSKKRKIRSDFANRVAEIVAKIPKGQMMTYAQVAKRAGSPGAARAVGTLMAKNYDLKVPCHRVIRSDGKIGNYNRGGSKKKRELLIKEGAIKS